MVIRIAFWFLFLLKVNSIYSQVIGKDINNFVRFSTFVNKDTLTYQDTLEVNIEISNNTEDTLMIYPEGIVYLRLSYTNYHKELILITDRKTGKKEDFLLPFEKILLRYKVSLEKNHFFSGTNEFTVIFISYPYWLKKKERAKSIFGRWESELNKIFVL